MNPWTRSQIAAYTEVIGEALSVLERIVLAFRSLRDPVARARRLRVQAARLWSTSERATRNGFLRRAARLAGRAESKWNEAARLQRVDAPRETAEADFAALL